MNAWVKALLVQFEVFMAVIWRLLSSVMWQHAVMLEVYQCSGGTDDTCPDDGGSMVVWHQYTFTRLLGVTSQKTAVCKCQYVNQDCCKSMCHINYPISMFALKFVTCVAWNFRCWFHYEVVRSDRQSYTNTSKGSG